MGNSGSQGSVPKQRLKSATMNKRINRGVSRDADEPGHMDDGSHSNQQYHGYTGHMSNTGMPAVGSSQYGMQGTRQSKTSSGARTQTWKNQMY